MALFDKTLKGRDDEMDDYGEGNAYDETPEEEEDYDEEEEEEEEAGAIGSEPRESVEPVVHRRREGSGGRGACRGKARAQGPEA